MVDQQHKRACGLMQRLAVADRLAHVLAARFIAAWGSGREGVNHNHAGRSGFRNSGNEFLGVRCQQQVRRIANHFQGVVRLTDAVLPKVGFYAAPEPFRTFRHDNDDTTLARLAAIPLDTPSDG